MRDDFGKVPGRAGIGSRTGAGAPETMRAEESSLPIVTLLGQHYGDGLVYLRDNDDRLLLKEAIARGLVSEEGYLTQVGYAYWQSRQR